LFEGDLTEHEVVIGLKTLKIRYKVSGKGNAGLVMLLTDITDIKNKEKELVLKSVVVQEMHHRIKNSLQMIVSLLNMQVRCSTNDETIRALQESISRISNISTIHEILCQSESSEQVSIHELVEKIRSNILKCATMGHCPIDINIAGDCFLIGGRQAVSIAVIMNELISNSLRHAFPGRESGVIDILLAKGNRFCSIAVSDNGVGYDPEKGETKNMGLKIVKTIVKDSLKGKVHISSSAAGTRVIVEFKPE
jgi:two-component sensor histidine kinase